MAKHGQVISFRAQKSMIFHIAPDNGASLSVLDIGFGTGGLGELIKSDFATAHWQVDGIDGFPPNCANPALLEQRIYRHIWHGLAEDLPSEQLASYDIICLLNVIEHLSAKAAKCLLRKLLESVGEQAFLFISTPLWFYPQDTIQRGDLEAHLIGVPATSMMALLPLMYSITQPLVGSFVLCRRSLDYVEFFQPTENSGFTYQMGMSIATAIQMRTEPGSICRLVNW